MSHLVALPSSTNQNSSAVPPVLCAKKTEASTWILEIRNLTKSWPFWAILFLKVLLSCLVSSHFPRELFIPFLNYFVESNFQNPWAHFSELGRLDSFPYPPIMLLVLAFFRVLCHPLLAAGTFTVTGGHLLVMRLPLLLADFIMCLLLLRWFPGKHKRVLWLYWASPIVIYINYCYGQLDIIPTALLLISLYFIHEKKMSLAMVTYGLSLASKSHLIFALPFMLLFVYQECGKRVAAKSLFWFLLTYSLCLIPFIGDPAFRKMVFNSVEQMRLFAFRVSLGSSDSIILIAPLAICTLFFRFASYPKWNWDLLFSYLGLLFCIFLLLIPPATGYFFWSFPFVIYFLCRSPQTQNIALYCVYAVSYLLFQFLKSHMLLLDSSWLSLANQLSFTLMEASLAGLTLNMYFFGVRSNQVYGFHTSPILIGLAGDSGSGKDFLVKLISELMGNGRITVTNGDDYHRWPRGHQMWNVYTHLNLKANDLYQEHEHAIALSQGGAVVRGEYNHGSGEFSQAKRVEANDILVFSGLHSLSLKSLRHLYDLKIFLDPEESLREDWKIERDCRERGYTVAQVRENLRKRSKDSEKFILPQRKFSDLVVRFSKKANFLGDRENAYRLSLSLHAQNSFDLTVLSERLSQFPELSVSHEPFVDTDWQLLEISGEISASQLSLLAIEIIPNLEELAPNANFQPDLNGCLQLVFLSCLSDQLRWKKKPQKRAEVFP